MTNQLPLFGLFQEWQQVDTAQKHQALDIEVYFLLVDSINRGIGLWSRDDLFAICRLLLVKPHHSLADFKEKFDQYLATIQPKVNQSNNISDDLNGIASPEQSVKDLGNGGSPAGKDQEGNELKGDNSLSTSEYIEQQPEVPGLTDNPVYLRFGGEGNGSVADANGNEPTTKFLFQTHYLPVDSRSMQQNMRSLRQQNFRRQQLVFDLNATMNRIARCGYFDQLVFKRAWTNRVPLVLLLDQRGSMVAFHALCDALTEVAIQTIELQPKNQTAVYYFWNCPVHQLFRTTRLTDPITINDWKRLHSDAQVVIVSDAGAARGFYSEERLGQTKWFLDQLRPWNVAWLNPMPRKRWKGTSAMRIAEWVPMFTIDSVEFNNAFKYLKKMR